MIFIIVFVIIKFHVVTTLVRSSLQNISDICRWKLREQNFVSFDSGNMHIKESKNTTLRRVKNQVLFFLSSWEANLSDLMVYWYELKRIFCEHFDPDYSFPLNNSHKGTFPINENGKVAVQRRMRFYRSKPKLSHTKNIVLCLRMKRFWRVFLGNTWRN